jgi:hypothetical protein
LLVSVGVFFDFKNYAKKKLAGQMLENTI